MENTTRSGPAAIHPIGHGTFHAGHAELVSDVVTFSGEMRPPGLYPRIPLSHDHAQRQAQAGRVDRLDFDKYRMPMSRPLGIWLSPATAGAVRRYAEREDVNVTTAAHRLITRGLAADVEDSLVGNLTAPECPEAAA